MEENLCISNITLHHKNKGKGKNKNLQDVTMIYPVIGWFKITKYKDKGAKTITKIVDIN